MKFVLSLSVFLYQCQFVPMASSVQVVSDNVTVAVTLSVTSRLVTVPRAVPMVGLDQHAEQVGSYSFAEFFISLLRSMCGLRCNLDSRLNCCI